MTEPATIIAPHNARMIIPPARSPRCLLAQHAQTAAEDEENSSQDDKAAATAATRPSAVLPARTHVSIKSAAAKQRSVAHAHETVSFDRSSQKTRHRKRMALPGQFGHNTSRLVGFLGGHGIRNPALQVVDAPRITGMIGNDLGQPATVVGHALHALPESHGL